MSSRSLRHLAATLVLLVLTGSGFGQEKGEVEIRPSEIKKGRDFAPREQIVSVRNPDDYRRSVGILAQASHAPVLVEVDALRQRRLDMYAGTTCTESLSGRMPTVPRTVLPVVTQSAPKRSRGREWGTILAIAIPALVFVGCLAWWRKQMKHASSFKAQLLELRQRRQTKARRERHRSHVKLIPRHR